MALSERDCPHGRQLGKCADCDLSHMEMAAAAEARRVDELTALRKDDEALIRQMLDALENHDGNYKLSKSAGATVDAAITAARARLEKAP